MSKVTGYEAMANIVYIMPNGEELSVASECGRVGDRYTVPTLDMLFYQIDLPYMMYQDYENLGVEKMKSCRFIVFAEYDKEVNIFDLNSIAAEYDLSYDDLYHMNRAFEEFRVASTKFIG